MNRFAFICVLYLGKVTFLEDRLNSLITASKCLEVNEIGTEFEEQEDEEFPVENKKINSETNNHDDVTIRPQEQCTIRSPVPPKLNKFKATRSHVCPDCERVFSDG